MKSAHATAFAAAFASAGLHARDYALATALTRYREAGGSLERGREHLEFAFRELPGNGHAACVSNETGVDMPRPRQPFDEPGGQYGCGISVPNSGMPLGSSSDGRGQADFGGEATQIPRAPPARTLRGAGSIALVQSTIKQGLIEMRKTADGRPWGAVGWHELDGMDRDGSIARLIKAKANPPKDLHAPLRSFLSNKLFEEICDAAQKQNDCN